MLWEEKPPDISISRSGLVPLWKPRFEETAPLRSRRAVPKETRKRDPTKPSGDFYFEIGDSLVLQKSLNRTVKSLALVMGGSRGRAGGRCRARQKTPASPYRELREVSWASTVPCSAPCTAPCTATCSVPCSAPCSHWYLPFLLIVSPAPPEGTFCGPETHASPLPRLRSQPHSLPSQRAHSARDFFARLCRDRTAGTKWYLHRPKTHKNCLQRTGSPKGGMSTATGERQLVRVRLRVYIWDTGHFYYRSMCWWAISSTWGRMFYYQEFDYLVTPRVCGCWVLDIKFRMSALGATVISMSHFSLLFHLGKVPKNGDLILLLKLPEVRNRFICRK